MQNVPEEHWGLSTVGQVPGCGRPRGCGQGRLWQPTKGSPQESAFGLGMALQGKPWLLLFHHPTLGHSTSGPGPVLGTGERIFIKTGIILAPTGEVGETNKN